MISGIILPATVKVPAPPKLINGNAVVSFPVKTQKS